MTIQRLARRGVAGARTGEHRTGGVVVGLGRQRPRVLGKTRRRTMPGIAHKGLCETAGRFAALV
jgi:hypothetical protein